jgi:polar amino acid transport system permease protein
LPGHPKVLAGEAICMAAKTETISAKSISDARDRANRLADLPWWAFLIILAGVILSYNFLTNETYNKIIRTLVDGVKITALAAITAYAFALLIGLITALMQLSNNIVVRNIVQLYVQIIRGVPIIVQILYWGFVIGPLLGISAKVQALVAWLNQMNFEIEMNRATATDIDFMVRGMLALAFSYGAFSSEVFRAGLQSIERGQREAGVALGLSWLQSLRFIILPQAFRRILPPLGNDFISMVKETALLSALGVGEITQLGKKYSAASFLYFQTYNTVAFLYLSLTLLLSSAVRYMEQRLKTDQRK